MVETCLKCSFFPARNGLSHPHSPPFLVKGGDAYVSTKVKILWESPITPLQTLQSGLVCGIVFLATTSCGSCLSPPRDIVSGVVQEPGDFGEACPAVLANSLELKTSLSDLME
jgi:hypothetical protein